MIHEYIWDYISTNNYVKYVFIIAITITVAVVVSKILRVVIGRFLKSSTHKLNVNPTKYNFLKNGLSFVIYLGALIVIFYSIPNLRSLGVSLFAGAGILTAIILFASQQAFSNIISGIFIVIFKPFGVGDLIKIGTDFLGIVEDITLRHTVIKNFENRRVIIPNSIISAETVINSTIKDERISNLVDYGISYDSDIDKAKEIIREEAEKHPNCIDNRTEEEKSEGLPKVITRVTAWNESSINIRALIWTVNHSEGWKLKCDLYESIKKRFDKEGIEIPFPHRTIVQKKQV
jgi:small-conductance mechanosensitive channel